MRNSRVSLGLPTLLGVIAMASAAETWPQGLQRVRERAAAPLVLAEGGQARAQLVTLSGDELVTHAADWLAAHAQVKRERGTAPKGSQCRAG